MALLVLKFGGTSVADCERIDRVADRVAETRAAGHDVVVVVSAMAGETDRLLGLARRMSGRPQARELDVLLASGEQVSMSLLAIGLEARGLACRSYTGGQVAIVTDEVHGKARIREMHTNRLRADLVEGRVPVIAGFQGVDRLGNITTLGRGGSDTTAVAVAAALGADECRIYTDVKGVYTTDPRVVPQARCLDAITFDEMLELAGQGSKVLQIRAVEFAGRYGVPLRVLSTFEEGSGTLISFERSDLEARVVSGIAFNRDEAEITVLGVPDRPGIAFQILGPVSDAHIEVDMIVQNVARDGVIDFTFTVHRTDYEQALELVTRQIEALECGGVIGDKRVVKISLVGVGVRSHAGIATRMFAALAQEGINIRMISTSEVKISVVVDEKYLELGVRALHEAFGLQDEDASMGLGNADKGGALSGSGCAAG
ncbi:MAG: aspartate kinase [Gammaproteobacteria bacterium]|jgi:aspartate kinase